MKTKLTIILVFFIFQISFGQKKNYSKKMDSIVTESALRIGIGSQRSFYSEIGFARHKSNKGPKCGFSGDVPRGYYSALEWTAKTKNYKDVFGIKIGYETSIAMILWPAIELKYLTNFENSDIVFTPKIGIGDGDFKWYIFYGYNISTNSNPFPNVGRHQFSLIFNLNSKIFEFKKTKQ